MGTEKMNWIYEGVSGLVDKEEYLTGRRVDKTFEIAQLEKEGNIGDFNAPDHQIPSLLDSKGQLSKLDLEYTLKEDPLQHIKRQQADMIKAILNNPMKMKKIKHLLEESLKKEKEEKKLRKKEKKRRKKEKKERKKREKEELENAKKRQESKKDYNKSTKDHKSTVSSGKQRDEHKRVKRERVQSSDSSEAGYVDRKVNKSRHEASSSKRPDISTSKSHKQPATSKEVYSSRNARGSPPSKLSDHRQQRIKSERVDLSEKTRRRGSIEKSSSRRRSKERSSNKLSSIKRRKSVESNRSSSSDSSSSSSSSVDSRKKKSTVKSKRNYSSSSSDNSYSESSSASDSSILSKHRSRSRSFANNSRNRERSLSSDRDKLSKLKISSSNKFIDNRSKPSLNDKQRNRSRSVDRKRNKSKDRSTSRRRVKSRSKSTDRRRNRSRSKSTERRRIKSRSRSTSRRRNKSRSTSRHRNKSRSTSRRRDRSKERTDKYAKDLPRSSDKYSSSKSTSKTSRSKMDWIDSDYEMVPIVNKNSLDPILMARPLSKERQERRNARQENGSANQRIEDVVDNIIISRYHANFNANTAKYNTYADNVDYRNAKRERAEDNDENSRNKRHISDRLPNQSSSSDRRKTSAYRRPANESISKHDEETELEAKRRRMLENGEWRESVRSKDVEMYIEASLKEDEEIQRNLNRIHSVKNY